MSDTEIVDATLAELAKQVQGEMKREQLPTMAAQLVSLLKERDLQVAFLRGELHAAIKSM